MTLYNIHNIGVREDQIQQYGLEALSIAPDQIDQQISQIVDDLRELPRDEIVRMFGDKVQLPSQRDLLRRRMKGPNFGAAIERIKNSSSQE